MINIPKGTKDVLPSESFKWQYVEGIARKVCKLFNVKEIRTPVFEHTELFTRSIGGDTDVVSKEMYTFLDKGERSITLKPEGTAPVARSFVENSLSQNSLALKMFYFTPVFRYERPQNGRLREHHQFGVEMYGAASPFMDGEVIALAYQFLSRLGITELKLYINSIGCPKCRSTYNGALKGFLAAHTQELCPTCRERAEHNPLRTLDCKDEGCQNILKSAPRIIDYICEECFSHMENLKSYLTDAEIPFEINPSIVRGLDYYTKTVFEFVTTALGAQGTVCGGGRYDNLVQSVGGDSTPCVGFGLGLERLIMLMEKLDLPFGQSEKVTAYIMNQSLATNALSKKIACHLRRNDISAECDYMDRSLKAQFKHADKIGAKFAIVIGEEELKTGNVVIKDLGGGEPKNCKLIDIVETLRR